MKLNNRNQAGFTIIELMISTTVFTFVLLVCSVAIVHVGRMYYKGTITSRTQDLSRKLGEDVSQAVQFGAGNSAPGQFLRVSGPTSFTSGSQTVAAFARCIGDIRYSYTVGPAQGAGAGRATHVVWKDRLAPLAPCVPVNIASVTPSVGGQEILGSKMRVARFDVTNPVGLYAVDIIVSYGDTDDLFEPASLPNFPNFSICKGVGAGGQFCSVAAYRTTVGKRL